MEYSKNLVSIVIPFYNEIHLIKRAVESVLKQNYQDLNVEVIIVNDGSICNSNIENELLSLSSKNNIIIKNNFKERGPGGARNCGIEISNGSYIAFLDSDDFWFPDKLSDQFKLVSMGHNFICTGYKFELSNINIFPPIDISDPLDVFLKQGIGTSTVLISRDLLGDTRFNNYRFSQDIDFWYRLASKEQFNYGQSNTILVSYNTNGTTKNKIVQAKHFLNVLDKNSLPLFFKCKIFIIYFLRGIYNHYLRN